MYFSIAVFADSHSRLSEKYEDFWGFESSPYEIERHNVLCDLFDSIDIESVLELGAGEGILTDKISLSGVKVDCTENNLVYAKKLRDKGYKVLSKVESYSSYDLTIIASYLEYIQDPKNILDLVNSKYIIVDVIYESDLSVYIRDEYSNRIVNEHIIKARFENLFIDGIQCKLPIYKMGSHCFLIKNDVL